MEYRYGKRSLHEKEGGHTQVTGLRYSKEKLRKNSAKFASLQKEDTLPNPPDATQKYELGTYARVTRTSK